MHIELLVYIEYQHRVVILLNQAIIAVTDFFASINSQCGIQSTTELYVSGNLNALQNLSFVKYWVSNLFTLQNCAHQSSDLRI